VLWAGSTAALRAAEFEDGGGCQRVFAGTRLRNHVLEVASVL
jgi:hypothetical protein